MSRQTQKVPPEAKEAALAACARQNRQLIACYKTCWGFRPCCQDEEKAFWDCFYQHTSQPASSTAELTDDSWERVSADDGQAWR